MQERQMLTVIIASVHFLNISGSSTMQFTFNPESLSLHAFIFTAFCVIFYTCLSWIKSSRQ